MRQRSLPIGLIGLIVILLAFIIWYGWSTQIAPYQAEQQARQQEVSVPPPSEEQLKAQLERNQQLVQGQQPPQKPANEKPKSTPKPQPPKPDPSREVVEYWWKYTPQKSGK
ncbi:hypothetical protein HRbin15_01880 [bacterium HR15]|nr:hypothetical protein HRbin15_01880 [bacterium HR15]